MRGKILANYGRMRIFSGRTVLVALTLSGCACVAASEPSAAPPGMSSQIVVAFRDPALDPSRGDYLQKVSAETGVTLRYLRPMSGGAHVLQVAGRLDAKALDALLGKLAARAEVQYAEEDRQLFPMRPH